MVWVILLAPLVWAFALEPRRLVTATAEVDVARAEALRVVVLSDVHLGSIHVDLERLEGIVDAVLEARPDVILFLGDLVATRSLFGDEPQPELAVPALSRLEARLGVYAVLGNHEHWFDAPAVQQAIESAGITVLENRAVALEETLWLVGVGDSFTQHDDIRRAFAPVPDEAFALVATHTPDLFEELPDRPSLVFAGHTHGGQVALPWYGPLLVPSRFGTRYARGSFHSGERRMHVTSGIGTSILPARFLVPPEILVMTLR